MKMKKVFMMLGIALVSLLFTACESSVSDVNDVKNVVETLRNKPQEWTVGVIDDGKATRFEHVNGLVMLRSQLPEKGGFKRHSRSLNLEPGGITLLPSIKEVTGEALSTLLLASEELANAAIQKAEAEKKEASVIKLE